MHAEAGRGRVVDREPVRSHRAGRIPEYRVNANGLVEHNQHVGFVPSLECVSIACGEAVGPVLVARLHARGLGLEPFAVKSPLNADFLPKQIFDLSLRGGRGEN